MDRPQESAPEKKKAPTELDKKVIIELEAYWKEKGVSFRQTDVDAWVPRITQLLLTNSKKSMDRPRIREAILLHIQQQQNRALIEEALQNIPGKTE